MMSDKMIGMETKLNELCFMNLICIVMYAWYMCT